MPDYDLKKRLYGSIKYPGKLLGQTTKRTKVTGFLCILLSACGWYFFDFFDWHTNLILFTIWLFLALNE